MFTNINTKVDLKINAAIDISVDECDRKLNIAAEKINSRLNDLEKFQAAAQGTLDRTRQLNQWFSIDKDLLQSQMGV